MVIVFVRLLGAFRMFDSIGGIMAMMYAISFDMLPLFFVLGMLVLGGSLAMPIFLTR